MRLMISTKETYGKKYRVSIVFLINKDPLL